MSSGFGDVVVVLPGLIGSVLCKDGEPLWGTSPGALWGTVFGDHLTRLKLTGPDDGEDDLGDGIVATDLVPNPEIVPGLWKQGGYSCLRKQLVARLGLTPNENYFEFPYDWRRDNRVAARKLARTAGGWLAEWRSRSGNADAKLVLLAHSMGGLVGRYFIECLEGWKIVRTLVSFGTPYRGSGNALDFLSNGFTWKAGPVSLFDGTEALRSFDSVYQLLPIYPFVEHGAAGLARIPELGLPNLDRRRAAEAASFHDEMTRANATNVADAAYLDAGTGVRPIVGIGQPTWQSATLEGARLIPSLTYQGQTLEGDGTVSRVSAIPLGDDGGSATYFATTHSALQSVAAALEHAAGVMEGLAIDLGKFRSDKPGGGRIALHVADAYPSDEPIRLQVEPSDYAQSLVGTIDRLDADAARRTLTLRHRQGRNVAEIVLPPGLYRVAVEGRGLRTVEDIFLVLDPGVAA